MADLGITWEDVVAHAASLSTFDGDAQDDVLDYVNDLLSETALGSARALKLARIYLAAHFATLEVAAATSATSAGPVVSETGGGLSRTYGQSVGDASRLGDTKYGQSYLSVVRLSPARAFVVL